MISSCSPSARAIASGDSSHIRVLLCTSVKTKVTTPPGRSVIAADDMVARRRTYVLLVDPDRSPAARVSLHEGSAGISELPGCRLQLRGAGRAARRGQRDLRGAERARPRGGLLLLHPACGRWRDNKGS